MKPLSLLIKPAQETDITLQILLLSFCNRDNGSYKLRHDELSTLDTVVRKELGFAREAVPLPFRGVS
jgi:hypothetical protein